MRIYFKRTSFRWMFWKYVLPSSVFRWLLDVSTFLTYFCVGRMGRFHRYDSVFMLFETTFPKWVANAAGHVPRAQPSETAASQVFLSLFCRPRTGDGSWKSGGVVHTHDQTVLGSHDALERRPNRAVRGLSLRHVCSHEVVISPTRSRQVTFPTRPATRRMLRCARVIRSQLYITLSIRRDKSLATARFRAHGRVDSTVVGGTEKK